MSSRSACIAVAVLAALRFFHAEVLWVEEAYPMAGAIEILAGRIPYRDFWYDKPPLVPLFYLLCGAWAGWALRLLGALFVLATAACARGLARDIWGERDGWTAAVLTAFVLTFGFPATTMAIAPDLFLVLPHFAAVWLAWRRRPALSGVIAGLAMLANFKGVFVAVICLALLRNWRFVAAFTATLGAAAAALVALGAWTGFIEQVWWWGRVYAGQGLRPWADGVARTLATLGYWSALVAASVWFLWRTPANRRGWIAWIALMTASAWMGARFFPRYWFALVPPLVLMAARGLSLNAWPALLLLIPLLRFGPAIIRPPSQDLALYADARDAVQRVHGAKTVFVWGYRPEISVLARASSGTPFLESQPLTGVFADRHLNSSLPAVPASFTRARRQRLRASHPEVIIDGLGLLNPSLAIAAYPDLAPWLEGYTEMARTRTCIIYRSNRPPVSRETR